MPGLVVVGPIAELEVVVVSVVVAGVVTVLGGVAGQPPAGQE